ncbi:protein-serine/threonine phosphatase, PP2C family [Skeletonema marinoi]|uniref:Protein-serine/threonine phosphatase, PP2C family n=1 Tax=Skeletonema marinoi TaxID=267567 RepID=A0AAD8YE82_9STRA|nr:protein-serine/threonine phosphatase, PP2C family [Skeletonema marinoi]
MEDQINQDRAFVLSPFMYRNIMKEDSKVRPVARLLGVFDGHARLGEKVSEYVVKTLPALLGSKLVAKEELSNQEIGKILQDTFVEIDASSPADPSGGCTASIVLQIDSNIYIANAGDSRSFVAVHIIDPISKAETTHIIYGTREDSLIFLSKGYESKQWVETSTFHQVVKELPECCIRTLLLEYKWIGDE